MNMQKTTTLTAAEQALIASFGAKLGELPGDADVTTARDRLVSALSTTGLPTRRVEAWHYTDLKSLLRAIPEADGESVGGVAPLLQGASVLKLNNGAARETALEGGVSVKTLADVIGEGGYAEALAVSRRDDAISMINGALVSDGYVVDVPEGAALATPVEIQAVHSGGQTHTRNAVTIGDGASATLVEQHFAPGDAPALVSAVTALTLGKDTEVTYIILQRQGAADTHLGKLKISLGDNAKLKLLVVNAGGKLVRQEIDCDVVGEGADLMLRGVNLLGGDTHTDITFTLGHNVPNTTSTETIRNVVFDRARGVFQGMIRVAPDAQKVDAKMACNTLLMTDDGSFSAKPELEIFADDVQCGHGATVTDLDPVHLYYMMARGIPEKVARGLLINAFLAEIVEELESEAISEAVEAIIADWLERHE
ncbi:Fe-S cluster assembly protein SufD [Martelella alba]|uniref:Fe-S cluster assembly protein SufD n=1 Tax=Martelella alba TaxID=2590451 RepID=A0A506U8X7_9HYPH|nr:Fe-S cluster assembly protein SufD [Martelella alba]TPW29796.1 Fe-S cluster assembly protein SufD [Martelella alba]